MKLIMENWRRYLNEGLGDAARSAMTMGRKALSAGMPVIDISGKGSNELGDPYEPGSIAWKIANDLATPCTSSADCAEKEKAEETPGSDWPTEDWSEEEYGEWYQENEEAVNKANFDINQFLAVKKHGPNHERWEKFFDEKMEYVNSAVSQKQADWALTQVTRLLDRQEQLARQLDDWKQAGKWSGGDKDQWLWVNKWWP